MKLKSILFGTNPSYERLARVFEYTAKLNSPNTPAELIRIDSTDQEILHFAPHQMSYTIENARKTKHHAGIINAAEDGELICLIDCDTMILKDLSDIENQDFDFAYTTRRGHSIYPINSGVVFIRVSDKTRDWYNRWYANVWKLLEEPKLLALWKRRYGRINQSGLGMLIESKHDLKLLKLQCSEWNSISETWKHTNSQTRIVHILGGLRRLCLEQNRYGTHQSLNLANKWKTFEQQAFEAERQLCT